MKRKALIWGVAALMVTAACDSDKNTPTGEGIFSPEMKIAEVREDGALSEQWNWDNGQLARVDHYYDGQVEGTTSFEYDGSRLTKVTSSEGETFTLSYRDGVLSQIDAEYGSIQVGHNGSHISSLKIALTDAMLSELFGELLGAGTKASGNSLNMDLTWAGDNISRTVMSASIERSIPVEDLVRMASAFGMDDLVNMIPPEAAMFLGGVELPVQFAMSEERAYTYDTQKNPMKGYLGEMDYDMLARILSSANVKTCVSGGTSVTYSVTLPSAVTILLAQRGIPNPITGSMPVEEGFRENYSYQYNDNGFPTEVTVDGEKTEYIYAE